MFCVICLFTIYTVFGNPLTIQESKLTKYKICPTNTLYSNAFTLQYLQYLYITTLVVSLPPAKNI
jgi:hypothetical protein